MKALQKARDVVSSCVTTDQLHVAERYLHLLARSIERMPLGERMATVDGLYRVQALWQGRFWLLSARERVARAKK